jgi:hypothetical protein
MQECRNRRKKVKPQVETEMFKENSEERKIQLMDAAI